MKILIVTGTDTGIGKTITTAALCALALDAKLQVSVVKPVQTGTSTDEPDDVETVTALTGHPRVIDLVRLDEPLAPDTAARRSGIPIPEVDDLADQVVAASLGADVTIVEGAGGVLVRLDNSGGTVLGLGTALQNLGHQVSYVVVTSLRLGTLNHTELTVNAIRDAGHRVTGLVIGSVDAESGLAETSNLGDLPRVCVAGLIGCIPAGVGTLPNGEFRSQARGWFDAADLREIFRLDDADPRVDPSADPRA